MTKIVLDNVPSGYNLNKINANFEAIAAALNDEVLYRDNPEGEPNQLVTSLDANSQPIYNLRTPVLETEAVPLGYMTSLYGNAPLLVESVDDAVAAAASATASAAAAAASAAEAAGYASGDVYSDAVSSVDSEIALYSGTGGKTIKRATTTGVLKATSGVLSAAVAGTDYLAPAAIGTTVQAYDADTAKTDVAQTYTASQRGTVTTDNDLSFDMSVTNNFSCTPTGNGTLTFTNITAGQSGFILLNNTSNYTISAAATTKVSNTFLATVSSTGVYLISYWSNGTNVYVVTSGALS